MNSLFDILNKVIVVTGATGVLAGGTAKYLQAQGAHIVYLGRNPEKLDKTLSAAEAISGKYSGYIWVRIKQ